MLLILPILYDLSYPVLDIFLYHKCFLVILQLSKPLLKNSFHITIELNMAGFRLSTDIISPLNSDISLNDVSGFSFGSWPDASVFDSNVASPLCTADSKKERYNSPLCATNTKECASALDDVTSDIRKQSSLNSEGEEVYQSTYEELKKSMDDLFGKNSESPIFPLQLKNKLNNKNRVSMHSETNAIDKSQNSEIQKFLTENHCPNPENTSEITNRKSEKCSNKQTLTNKLKKSQHRSKDISTVSESSKGAKNKNESCIKTDASVNKKNALVDKKTISKIISKSDGASSDVKEPTSKKKPEKRDDKKIENVRGYNFKCQKKIKGSDVKPFIKKEGLSIEKSIELAVSMEMDNIRRFVLHQNSLMHKNLLELQETVKKQNEVTDYLFSVIDGLLDANKQLVSKCTYK